ncbi:hypothetical protein [Tetragenococcus solitarius]|uniref:Phage resistance protein n=1 Tax=Tetragenococcus solitarius TaxID=71453 RepID=A0ABN3Y604_9ENTE|nr:hypothetical protein [Tetragenococcus solitarius]
MNAKELDYEFDKVRLNLDKVETPNLSKIKEIVKRVHFADIKTKQQAYDNEGLAFYKLNLDSTGDYFTHSLPISYTTEAAKTGVVYGTFTQKVTKKKEKVVEFEGGNYNNYVRFLADIANHKVIYSDELERFVIVRDHSYKMLDQAIFEVEYSVDPKQKINDFLDVIFSIYHDHIQVKTHDYTIEPYIIAGIDWAYDCKQLKPVTKDDSKQQLFSAYYDVSYENLNLEKAEEYTNMIAAEDDSLHNLRLIHAYVLLARMGLVSVEHSFILKDFGRTGKGLFMKTFPEVFKMNSVNFDNLMGGTMEASNEWLKFIGCDISHANESGAINPKAMRFIRKIATQENVSGRKIQQNTIDFKIKSVLILDTNEKVDIGKLTANLSRVVKVAFKDRPEEETEAERYKVFAPYWDYIAPNGEESLTANVSFLISSLEYLSKQNGKFVFKDVALKNYAVASELTDLQIFLIEAFQQVGYVPSKDEALHQVLFDEYGVHHFRRKDIKDDLTSIGLEPNYPTTIKGVPIRVIRIKDKKLFKKAQSLLEGIVV